MNWNLNAVGRVSEGVLPGRCQSNRLGSRDTLRRCSVKAIPQVRDELIEDRTP